MGDKTLINYFLIVEEISTKNIAKKLNNFENNKEYFLAA
tara:strand:+ start:895 stop:1011 length:117 start_codon:yes stop_codon:yes gene_type:complete